MKAFNRSIKAATSKGGQTAQPKNQPTKTIVDNRASTVLQRKLQQSINTSPRVLQAKFGNGLPAKLKANLENLSGLSLDGVQVHYNASEPAKLGALAYAQGNDIYLALGQEKHLAHEAWHVVQQKQGRVRPTMQLETGAAINDNVGLEQEADRMGVKAAISPNLQQANQHPLTALQWQQGKDTSTIQRQIFSNMPAMWVVVAPHIPVANIQNIVNQDPVLQTAYQNVSARLGNMDFIQTAGTQPNAGFIPINAANNTYPINYGLMNTLAAPYNTNDRFVGAILHEMMHITAALEYITNVGSGSPGHFANMHLPAPTAGQVPDVLGFTDNQYDVNNLLQGEGADSQINTMVDNYGNLVLISQNEALAGAPAPALQQMSQFIADREFYMRTHDPTTHYDTVLTDILYNLIAQGHRNTATYAYASQMLQEANARRNAFYGEVAAIPLPPGHAPVIAVAPGAGNAIGPCILF